HRDGDVRTAQATTSGRILVCRRRGTPMFLALRHAPARLSSTAHDDLFLPLGATKASWAVFPISLIFSPRGVNIKGWRHHSAFAYRAPPVQCTCPSSSMSRSRSSTSSSCIPGSFFSIHRRSRSPRPRKDATHSLKYSCTLVEAYASTHGPLFWRRSS